MEWEGAKGQACVCSFGTECSAGSRPPLSLRVAEGLVGGVQEATNGAKLAKRSGVQERRGKEGRHTTTKACVCAQGKSK